MTKHIKKRDPSTYSYLRKYNLQDMRKREKKTYAYESEGQYRNIRMAARNASKGKMKFTTHIDRFDKVIIVTREC